MNSRNHDSLIRLRDLILEERACAIALDMEGLHRAMAEKDTLLRELIMLDAIDDRDKGLAAQIRQENRRNAYLFKSTLGWIRQTMEFFGRAGAAATYSPAAATVSSNVNGRLLSGRI